MNNYIDTNRKKKIDDRIPTHLVGDNSKQSIFLEGLKKSTGPQTIIEALAKYGEINYLRCPYNKNRLQNLGYALVVFSQVSIVDLLLTKVKVVLIDGRHIRLQPYQRSEEREEEFENHLKNRYQESENCSQNLFENYLAPREQFTRKERRELRKERKKHKRERGSESDPIPPYEAIVFVHTIRPSKKQYLEREVDHSNYRFNLNSLPSAVCRKKE